MSLIEKATSSMFWVFMEQIGNKVIQFIIGLILARLLSPSQFGLLGMLTIFISVSETISVGGFNQALIRKKKCTEDDYNTSFIFNIFVGLILYSLLFISSNSIAKFFNEPILSLLLRFLALQIIIDSLSFVQNAKLTKDLRFKDSAKISVTSQLIGGLLGIMLAYHGIGVWSLALKVIISRSIRTVLLIYYNKWLPKLRFSAKSFRDLFGFGSKMLLTSIVERLYSNIYNVVIGKYYSKASLGYYTRANQFKKLLSEQIITSIQRVSIPLLSTIQDEKQKLQSGFKKMVNVTYFISIFGMMFLLSTARYMILFLLGYKWSMSINYLQLIAISGILYPVSQVNLNYLQVTGKSNLILKLQLLKKITTIPFIAIGIICGVNFLIYGMIAISVTDYVISSWFSAKLANYSIFQQLKHFSMNTLILSVVSGIIYFIGYYMEKSLLIHNGIIFMFQSISYFILVVLLFEFAKSPDYLETKSAVSLILKDKLIKHIKNNHNYKI